MNIQEGELFAGRYRLLTEKGRGAFGDVWLAHDEQIDLDVAIKIYIALDDRGIEDFKSEYKTAYTLNHPNLLHAYHFDVEENRPFLVMPYCPGSAESLIGCTDETMIWRFIRDVASGLAYLHGRNILHRDIKPDNILTDGEGNFLITDFGVSTKMKSTLRRNSTRAMSCDSVSGTIGYMAPELFTRNPETVKATDIWALGATLYEIINGELPFFGQGGIMMERGAEIPELKGSWSKALKATVDACLAKETWDRPTASQLAEYASKCAQGECVQIPWKRNVETESSDEKELNERNDKDKTVLKTLGEKLELCSKCKKREFDPESGLKCSLTKVKPDFENECVSFEADEEQIAFQKSKDDAYEKSKSVSGWLAFFLWVGIGLSAAVTLTLSIIEVRNYGYGLGLSLVTLVPSLAIAVIAIDAITAFYLRRTNAVALAKTYIAMIVLDGVVAIILSIVLKGFSAFPQATRQFIWSAIWFTYLLKSERVEDLIPKRTRTWQTFEKVVLVIYVVYMILLTLLIGALY